MITTAFFQGLFSYDGWDVLNFGIEEVENPRRTMSLAIPIGIFIIAIIYVATNLSYFVVLSVPQVLSTPAVAQVSYKEGVICTQFVFYKFDFMENFFFRHLPMLPWVHLNMPCHF